MSAKKKQEFETWYATQLQEELNFKLKEGSIAYCKLDAALLKAGCQKFVQEFKDIAQFDPFEKFITGNRYWRKCHLSPEIVAVGPPRGWKGARVNHSRVALEWLLWCEHQLFQQVENRPMYPSTRIAILAS